MDSNLESVRDWFNRIYLGGIPLMMNNDTAFLSFICVLTAIEALAGYRYPGDGETAHPGERFRRFIKAYFPSEYHILVDELWNFRNGMIHGFCPRRFFLMEHKSQLHMRQIDGGATILNAEDFYAALLMASRKYFAELEGSPELVSNFTARLQSDQGGNLAVGIIEVL